MSSSSQCGLKHVSAHRAFLAISTLNFSISMKKFAPLRCIKRHHHFNKHVNIQDHLIPPLHPTRQSRNKMPRRSRTTRKTSIKGTTAQKARKVTARRARAAPTIRGVTCQRCLLRLQQFPDHVCTRSRGYNSCKHCIQVRHKCIPVSSTETASFLCMLTIE